MTDVTIPETGFAQPASGTAGVPDPRVFHTLDALRGIAAIGVVAFHLSGAFLPFAAPGGYLAVDLFFMMSGVVLSHAYEDRFRRGMGTADFMRARLIRLYPLFLLGTLFGIAVAIASFLGGNAQGWDAAGLLRTSLLALVFLPNPVVVPVDQLFPLNIPCWSLFLELVVNLLFVVAWPWLTSRRLLVLAGVTGVAVLSVTLVDGHIDQGSTLSTLPVGFARTLFGFTVGVLIARHVARDRRGESSLSVLALVAVFGAAIAGRPEGDLRAAWDAACVLLVFPLLVGLGTRVEPGPGARRIATFLGLTSYAIYVLHSPLSSVLNSAMRYFANHALPFPDPPYLGVVTLALLAGGCWWLDRAFDRPIRRRLDRLVSRPGSSRSAA